MKLIAMDTETGGIDTKFSVLTIYMASLDENLNVIEEIDLKLKPDDGNVIWEQGAMDVNKIDLAKHLADPNTITYSQAKIKILDFLNKSLVNGKKKSIHPAGHNVTFDLDFIWAHLISKEEWSKIVHYRLIDTSPVTSFLKFIGWWPDQLGNLGSLVKHLGLKVRDAHNAKDDTLMFIDVLRAMRNLFADKKGMVAGIDADMLKLLER